MNAAQAVEVVSKVVDLSSYRFKNRTDDAEDVKYHDAPPAVKKATTVVYNHFNIEAILTAAFIKKAYPEFTVVSAAQLIGNESELYVWLGVKQMSIVGRNTDSRSITHRVYSSFDPKARDENGYRPNMIDTVCGDFMIVPTGDFYSISFKASHFFEPDTSLDDLAYIYQEVSEALAFLSDRKTEKSEEDPVMRYMRAVSDVKTRFVRSYRQAKANDSGTEKNVFLTNFSEQDFMIALRLIKLTHGNFVNHTIGQNGPLMYTNLQGLKLSQNQAQEETILMN